MQVAQFITQFKTCIALAFCQCTIKYYLVFFSLFIDCFSFSQQSDLHNIRFRHLTMENGLPSNEVKSILQDKNGFMWFGTSAGLVRYDGYSFKTYTDTSVSSDPAIFCMILDGDGKIWIGSRRNGLSVFNPKTEKFKRYIFDKNDSTSLNLYDVTSLCKDKDGDIWVGTMAGLNKYDRQKDRFIQYHKLSNSPGTLFELYVDESNLLWCCSHYNGLTSFDKKSTTFIHYPIPPELNCGYSVISIDEDSSGIFFLSTRIGYAVFNPTSGKFIKCFKHDKNNPSSLSGNDMFLSKTFFDSRHIHWIGTWHDGLNIYDRQENNFIRYQYDVNNPFSIINNNIRCIYEDKAGFVWIGTEGGISIYNPNTSAFTIYRAITNKEGTLSGNSISAIFEDSQNRLWVGTSNSGLNLLDCKQNKITAFRNNPSIKNSLANDIVTSICEDESGMIWIMNTWGNPKSIFNPVTKNFYNISETLFPKINCPETEWDNVVFKDSKGLIWIGGHGAHAYDVKEKKAICYKNDAPYDSTGKNLRYIWAICEDNGGNIWLGSFINGLSVYYPRTDKFDFFKSNPRDKSTLSHNSVSSIYQDSKGKIWIGTLHGLNLYLPVENKFKRYFQKDGLPDNSISSIVEDNENNLWVSTSNGLCKFNPAENTFFTYDITDGLPGNEFTGASCKGKDGKFYFGTSNGMVSFFPEQIKNNPNKPNIVLTKFSVLNKPWEFQQELSYIGSIMLSYREYFFTLEFSALDFTAPEKNQYAYKLEGFNKDWVNIGSKREVTFTNLDAGDYVLKVKGSNNHGLWSDEINILKITITPPFWKTIWFRICVFIFIIVIIAFYIKWRERKLKQEKKILEQKVEERTTEIREKNKHLEKAHHDIEEKNNEILSSISYAQRIQEAILPPSKLVKQYLQESFVLYKPKDIVAGDFYWMEVVEDKILFAACDCTGHGVPGAFVSIVSHNALNRAVKEFGLTEPAKILDKVNELVEDTFSKSEKDIKDGMDVALCKLTMSNNKWTLEYAGAYNSIYLIRNKELKEIKADKQPIGKYAMRKLFTNNAFELQPNDTIYAFSDGYADQFGGEKGKKFKYSQFENLLVSIQDKSMTEQREILNETIEKWRGELEQIDDICIIGVRV